MAEIRFEKVCKFFDKARIIEDLDLTIQDGKFTVLVLNNGGKCRRYKLKRECQRQDQRCDFSHPFMFHFVPSLVVGSFCGVHSPLAN